MQMQARKERVRRNTKKNETILDWNGRSTHTPNPSAIKGSKLNMEHHTDVQLNSVHFSVCLSLLQPTTCNHYS